MGSLLLHSSPSRRPTVKTAAQPCSTAFTLIEILVVVAIISILAALILPAVASSRRAGMQTNSVNNLRQWGVAFSLSVQENNNLMPSDGGQAGSTTDENAWYNRLPPRINVTALKDARGDLPRQGVKSLWINPGAPLRNTAGIPFCYGFNSYLSSAEEPNMSTTRVTYAVKTPLLVEKDPDASPSGTPTNIRSYFVHANPNDPDAVCNVLFVDGHVDGVKRSVFSSDKAANASSEDEFRQAPFTWLPFIGAQM